MLVLDLTNDAVRITIPIKKKDYIYVKDFFKWTH